MYAFILENLIFILPVGIVILFWMICKVLIAKPPENIVWARSHVVVTGGSQGIGKEMAKILTGRGASVTLVARTLLDLQATAAELQAMIKEPKRQRVQFYSLDLLDLDQGAMNMVIAKAESNGGPVDLLINNAGGPVVQDFDAIPLTIFEEQMKFNYLSSVGMAKAVLPTMKRQRSGRILFVSSLSGQIGVYGYSPYAAAKFALRGFAEALQMEVQPFNISLHLGCPPATATARFLNQRDTKPEETRQITGKVLLDPEIVASAMIQGLEKGEFLISIGHLGWMLRVVTCGASPVRRVGQAVEQILLLGPLRMICLMMKVRMDRVVVKCHKQKNKIH